MDAAKTPTPITHEAWGDTPTGGSPAMRSAGAEPTCTAAPGAAYAGAAAIESRRDQIRRAADFLGGRIGMTPRLVLALGTGLDSVSSLIEDPRSVPYTDVPGMQPATSPGHVGQFLAGTLCGVPVLCMRGRLHQYEGYTPQQAVLPLLAARELGARAFIATNAAGGINENFYPGQVVLIRDHINLTGANPLIGPNDPLLGPRFPDMSDAYSRRLRAVAHRVANGMGYHLEEGVYLATSGPMYETPAEIRAFRTLGADLGGMSTVWEITAAVHCGMETLALSLVANMAAGMTAAPITEEEVTATAALGAVDMLALVKGVVPMV